MADENVTTLPPLDLDALEGIEFARTDTERWLLNAFRRMTPGQGDEALKRLREMAA